MFYIAFQCFLVFKHLTISKIETVMVSIIFIVLSSSCKDIALVCLTPLSVIKFGIKSPLVVQKTRNFKIVKDLKTCYYTSCTVWYGTLFKRHGSLYHCLKLGLIIIRFFYIWYEGFSNTSNSSKIAKDKVALNLFRCFIILPDCFFFSASSNFEKHLCFFIHITTHRSFKFSLIKTLSVYF